MLTHEENETLCRVGPRHEDGPGHAAVLAPDRRVGTAPEA